MLPMAWSLTTLAWGGIDYKSAYVAAGEWDVLLDTIKWGTDFILKSHTDQNEFYVQVRNINK